MVGVFKMGSPWNPLKRILFEMWWFVCRCEKEREPECERDNHVHLSDGDG